MKFIIILAIIASLSLVAQASLDKFSHSHGTIEHAHDHGDHAHNHITL